MSRTITTDRWNIRVNETEANGEGRVHITHKGVNKTLSPSFDGAQELVQLLEAILPVEEYKEPVVPVVSET
jgi:predicted sulfurtransferase